MGSALLPSASWAAGTAVQATWHARQAEVYAAQAAGRGGAGVLVAVLDGWVDVSHRDFEGRARTGVNCVGGTCVPGQQHDSCWHGTHVAGLIASSSFGVAPKAQLLPVQVLTADPSGACLGTSDDVAAGIRYAVGAGARVVNLSLGAELPDHSPSSPLAEAVRYAVAKDVLVVFSAGNNDDPVANSYDDGALIVAATAPSGRLAGYSQYGAGISLAAPGGEGTATDQEGKPSCSGQADCVTSLLAGNRYGVAAGTSMAAPQVSGAAALLLGQDPARHRDQLIQRLRSTARPLAQAGAGLLDASAALGVTPLDAPARAGSAVVVASPASNRPTAAGPSTTPSHQSAAPAASVGGTSSSAPPALDPSRAPVAANPAPEGSGVSDRVVRLRATALPAPAPRLPLVTVALAVALLLLAGAGLAATRTRAQHPRC